MALRTYMVVPPHLEDSLEVVQVPAEDSYEFIKSRVGGWIESVYSDDTITIWANEESRLEGMELNVLLNKILGPAAENYDPQPSITTLSEDWLPITTELLPKDPNWPKGLVLGTAVLSGPIDGAGNETGLDDQMVEAIKQRQQLERQLSSQ